MSVDSSVLWADSEAPSRFVPPQLEIAAIQAHPRFDEAVRASATATVELHSRSRFFGWFLSDRALAILAHVAVALDSDASDDDPRSGLTPTRFKAFCAGTGLCSEGRATAMLAFMRLSGHLETSAHPADGRITRLTPGAKLLETMRSRLRHQLNATAMVCPEVAPAVEWLGDRDFERRMGTEFLYWFTHGFRLLRSGSSLRLFSDRDAGVVTLFALMLQGDPADPVPSGQPLPFSIAALSRRFRVSRTHILRLVRDAEAAGLMSRLGDKGEQVLLAPALREDLRHFFAAMFRLVSLSAWPLVAEGGTADEAQAPLASG